MGSLKRRWGEWVGGKDSKVVEEGESEAMK